MPGPEEEALRDLVRAREAGPDGSDAFAGTGSPSCCCVTGSGLRTGDAWTERHRDWLGTIELAWPAAQATLLDARGAIDGLCHRRDQLEREIVAMVPSSPWQVQVGRLRCLRGIDTLTAVGLCAEIGDFERFARAEQLMSYLGLVPCENTTGQQRRLGSITKTGSAHARRLLIEAAWHYRPRPDRQGTDRPSTGPATRSHRDRVVSPTTTAPHLDPPRETRASAARSSRSPPPANSPGSSWAITQIE